MKYNKLIDRMMGVLAMSGLVLFEFGCSSIPPESLTEIKIIFQSGNDLNPDVNNRPSPVDICIYQLRNDEIFKQRKFFDLYLNAQKTLDKTLLDEHNLEIKVKENREFKIPLNKKTRYLGFIIAYYDIFKAKWRDTYEVTIGENSLLVTLNATNFKIHSQPNGD